MDVVDLAQIIAMDAHWDQPNKHDGTPYILHPHRVFMLCRDEGLDEIHQAVAWMHDVVEDCPRWTLDLLYRAFPEHPEIPMAVDVLSKPQGGMPIEEYYGRLMDFPIAARVKLRDIQDNFSQNHLIEDGKKRGQFAYKYSLGQDMLSPFRVNP